MGDEWKPLPLDRPLFANLDADSVVGAMVAIENGFINEQGGHTRFPGLRRFAQIDPNAKRIYLHDVDDDLIAATDKGQVYRLDRAGNKENVTAVAVSGGRRVIFAKTDRELLMAAGGPVVRLRNDKTEVLSSDAPNATHVMWLDNYTIAIEVNSGRFFHSRPGEPDVWDALDTFSADGAPDNINSAIVTPFRELLLGGSDSIEQFERTASGETPFYRRWAIGDGVKLPYAMLFADNAMWTINSFTEWVRFSGQTSQAVSSPIGRLLEKVDDWREAWMGGYPASPLNIIGQKFMVLQLPFASNGYGTKGLTICYDYRGQKFFSLYGWDNAKGVPTRWPGWSHWTLWNKVFVGGDDGWIYQLTDETYANGPNLQRWLIRTAHMAQGAGAQVTGFRLRIKRGIGGSATAPTIRVRCSRDGRPLGSPIARSLGKAGERLQMVEFGSFGNGMTFQFEISSADDCPIELMGADVKAIPLGH